MPTERRRTKPKADQANRVPNKREDVSAPHRSQKRISRKWVFLTFNLFLLLSIVLYNFRGFNILRKLWSLNEDGVEELFEMVDLPGKGKGLIAKRDIAQGELVLRERPLFVVPKQINSSPATLISQKLANVTAAHRAAYLELSYVNFPKYLDPRKNPNEVALAIFQTNAVQAGSNTGIFPRMARLNHGCAGAFNVVYSWREKEGTLVVYALKGIRKGEELLTSYTDPKRPRDERRAYLTENYGFHCTCEVCSLPQEESRASDTRLIKIAGAYERFRTWGDHKITGPDAIQSVQNIWLLEDEEGYWSERGQLAADAAWVAASHQDAVATREWAKVAIEWYGYEVGADSEQVMEMQQILTHPERHRAWGSRKKLIVGYPKLN